MEGWQSGLMRRTRNAVGRNPSQVQILYPPPKYYDNFLDFFHTKTIQVFGFKCEIR